MPTIHVDYHDWWNSDEPLHHRLYLGGQSSAWDECCSRRIMGKDSPAILGAIGPYLTQIAKAQDALPVLHHPHLIHRHAPLFYGGPVYSTELTYVDLSAAYWSIYTRTTLDVQYDGINDPLPGRVRFLDAEAFRHERLFRNALLGSLRRTRRRGLDHGAPFVEAVPPGDQRPNLWGLVMDCLELIAWEMRRLGAIYVHTDGYIFLYRDMAEYAISQLNKLFKLSARIVVTGPGLVTGLARWTIGDTVHGPGTPELGWLVDTMQPVPENLQESLTAMLKA